MSTTAAQTSPVPEVAEAFTFAQGEIRSAASELWPGAQVELSAHMPSVTGYVHRIRVGGRELYAKHSFLGMSLVSILRGVAGDWGEVQRAQAAYVQRADALMQREAAQLRLLAGLGRPRVCKVAGLARGVLFTEPVPGPTLAGLLLRDPSSAAGLFESVFADLQRLHRSRTAQRLAPAGAISERSVAATFQRKFNGISGQTYLTHLGAERCTEAERAELTALLRAVVARLHRMRPTALAPGQAVLTYGDLKPEHLVFPDGPGGRSVLIDPGLLRARASVDAAKLTSRTVLLLVSARPGVAAVEQVVEGLGAFAEQRMQLMAPKAARSWLRELLIVWLMDTVNILTTFLSAPSALPLPPRGRPLVERAVAVCTMADRISTPLGNGTDAHRVWQTALAQAKAVAV
ncbi:Phosphotransferase enzyme family protein [Streptomyces sp. DconLS]|uniref:phosphotransferase n=1 Tax=Streptomyces sp. LamerLS-31b TaxID=1839765 RepID=UPI00081F3087|nr:MULTISPECIES: phosphotransferase [unclassified Streptomyces]SCF67696.1 Phosphotransferase enzyme family protein [Streptomyces sp. DconLS]SCF79447.1 Phosphotransferase enzyme family protein [Streptomyces sp. LamerLS-31b]